MNSTALRQALRRGELVRAGHDRYVPLGPVATDVVAAAAGSGVALRGLSAARGWGLPAGDDTLQVLIRNGRRPLALPGALDVRSSRRWDVVEHGGVLLTDLAQTCADVACENALDVSVPVLDAALRAGLAPAEMRDRLGRGVTGADVARRALELADGRAESPLESRLRLLLVVGGLPPLDLQHVVRDRDGSQVARVDLWYPGLVVEADGFEFHSRREEYRRDRDKGVEFARLGLLAQRFSWERVVGAGDAVLGAVADASRWSAERRPRSPTALPRRRRERTAIQGDGSRVGPAPTSEAAPRLGKR